MNRDPYGLGQLLYAFRPGPPPALLAAGMTMTLEHGHDDCGISTFCRNPLHPGPCAGWKRGLGKLAPGALDALEKARKAKVAERRLKTAQAKATAAGGLTRAQLESPLHAKKSIAKKANQLLGNSDDKARAKADRVILNKAEIKRYSKIKAAQVDDLAAKHGLPSPGMEGVLGTALNSDNKSGRDIAYRASLEAAARMMAESLAKKLCKKGDGDCDGKPYEDLKRALEEGFRPAVANGDDSELEGLVKARNGGQLLTPTGKNPYTRTQPRPARPGPALGPAKPNAAQKAQAKKAAQQLLATPPAKAAPAATPGAPGTTPATPAVGRLSDQALVNGVKMHGATSGQGKDAAAELKRRGLGPDGKPLAAPSPAKAAPAPAPAAPATPPAPAGPPSTPAAPAAPPARKLTPGLPGTTPARPAMGKISDQTLVNAVKMHGTKPGLGADSAAELKRRGLDSDGNPLATGATTPAAPKWVTHLQDLLTRGGFYTDQEMLDALNSVTKSEHDQHLSSAQKADVAAELQAMATSTDPDVRRQAKLTAARLGKGNPPAATPPAKAATPPAVTPAPTSAPNVPAPSATPPANASADAKHAAAVALRTAPRAGTAKVQLDAYDKLTKDEFDSLPDATKKQIVADLNAAEAKFLDPKKKAAVAKIRDYLDGKAQANGAPVAAPATTPAATPAAPPPPSLSTPQVSPMVAKLAKHEQLTPADYRALSAARRQDVDDDLDFLSNSGTPDVRARALALQAKLAGKPAAPAAPSTPAAPSAPGNAKAVKAADLTASINEAATGTRMNDAAKARLATALEAEHAKGDGVWARAFADKAAANIGQKTKGYTQYSLTVSQLDALKAELADAIDGKRTDTPMLDAIRTSWQGRIGAPDLGKQLDALNAPNAPAGPAHGLEAAIDAARGLKGAGMQKALLQLRLDSRGDAAKGAAVDAFHAEVINDPGQPNWLRLNTAINRPDADPAATAAIKKAKIPSQAIYEASGEPSAFPTSYSLADSFASVDEALLADSPDFVKGALYDHRSHVVSTLFDKSGTTTRTMTDVAGTVFLSGLLGHNKEPNLSRYNTLDDDAKLKAKELLDRHIDNLYARGMHVQASELQTASDKVDGTVFDRTQKQALFASHNRLATFDERTHAYDDLDKAQFDALPDAHKGHLLQDLERTGANTMAGFTERTEALDVHARLMGDQPNYGSKQLDSIVKGATYWKPLIDNNARALGYWNLDEATFNKANPYHRDMILDDMADIADGNTTGAAPVSTATRYLVQRKRDEFLGPRYNATQRNAIDDAKPGSAQTSQQRLTSYDHLSKSEHDQLPLAYQKAIRDDLDALLAVDPALAAKVLQKIDPNWAPPYVAPTPSTHVTTSTDPVIKAALDVIYGTTGHKTTQAEQFKVYTDLQKGHFDQLQPQEQQVVLGDLAYIATTAKSAATQKRAERLLDRFTPPGTTPGTVGTKQPILIPANAVAGQTLQPDPKGVTGLLFQKKGDKGQNGDGHTKFTNGKQGPWGKFGAAGIMLRHVDDSGVERFLMVERGPGISHSGQWQYPGGAIDSKESMYEGGTREVIEELGFTDADLADAAVHGHHENRVPGVQDHPNGWLYTSIAATVKTQLKPDLTGWNARHETSDAKWMTRAEIDALDKRGKLLDPIANGEIHKNVISMFPSAVHSVGRPGPVTQRPARARPPAPPTPHKPSIATNRIVGQAGRDKLSADIKGPLRASYSGKSADERLAAIHSLQGFDRTPTVKSKSEIDALLATGDYIEIWRGVTPGNGKTAAQIAEEFRTGPNWGGFGVFGNGYYFAGDEALAVSYSGGRSYRPSAPGAGAVIRALIPKSAVIMDHRDVQKEQRAIFDGKYNPDAYRWQSKGGRTLVDEGRYASAKGVDSISVSARDYKQRGGSGHLATKPVHIVQNRSILIVEAA